MYADKNDIIGLKNRSVYSALFILDKEAKRMGQVMSEDNSRHQSNSQRVLSLTSLLVALSLKPLKISFIYESALPPILG